jgi:hypothetical protein
VRLSMAQYNELVALTQKTPTSSQASSSYTPTTTKGVKVAGGYDTRPQALANQRQNEERRQYATKMAYKSGVWGNKR